MSSNQPLERNSRPRNRRSSTQRLTDTRLQSLIKKKWNKEIVDGAVGSLVARVDASGEGATWSIPLRISQQGEVSQETGRRKKGQKRRYTIGMYPAVSIEEAREIATRMRGLAKRGSDPNEALGKGSARKGGEDAGTAARLTVVDLSKHFMTEHVLSRGLDSASKYQDAFDVHINPRVGAIDADLLTREDARKVMEAARAKRDRPAGQSGGQLGGIEAARTVIGVMHHLIEWGKTEQKLKRKDNPCSLLTKNLPRKKRGEIVLTLEESRVVYKAAIDCGYPFGDHLRLQFLNAFRLSNWADVQSEWIDLSEGLVIVPSEEYKSDRVLVMPLVPQAIEIIRAWPRPTTGPYLLSSTGGDTRIQGVSKFYRTRLESTIIANTGARFPKRLTTQTIRRTVATRCAEILGEYGEKFVPRVLGHGSNDVTAIYNQYPYIKELRRVLGQWANDLTAGVGNPATAFSSVTSPGARATPHE